MPPSSDAIALAQRLRGLRERHFGHRVTQQILASALSTEQPVQSPTISTWENLADPVVPPASRLRAYARFFATPRSLEPKPRLLNDGQLDPDEKADLARLEEELLRLREGALRGPLAEVVATPQAAPVRAALASSFWELSDNGPVTIICPDFPEEDRPEIANSSDPNFTDLFNYGDGDALIELFGHLRATNPTLPVYFRRATLMIPDDLSGHVVLLGGIGWNPGTRRLLERLGLPVRQVRDERVETGEVFQLTDGGTPYFPEWAETFDGKKELVEDVGLLARVPNPTNSHCTLTVCNGIHSRGVLGAVRCLTDARLRTPNEAYLTERFGSATSFGMLMRVEVVGGRALTPDLSQPHRRLFEWSDQDKAVA